MAAAKAKSTEQAETKRFLDSWSSIPDEELDCPPDYFLVEVANETEGAHIPPGDKESVWADHVNSCGHCKGIIKLLRNPAPSADTLRAILERARRDADEITFRPNRARHTTGLLSRLEHRGLRSFQLQQVAAAALVVVLVGVVWLGVRRLSFFERSPEVATVTFQRDESKEFYNEIYAEVAQIQKIQIPRHEEKKYVDEFNQNVVKFNKLKQEQKITKNDRGNIAFLMAQHKSELTTQIARNREKKPDVPVTPPAPPALPTESDTQAIFTLVNTFSKKNGDVDNVPTTLPNGETIKTVSDQITVEMDDNEVTVSDKVAERSPQQADDLFKALQRYAAQEPRAVFLTNGQQRTKIDPVSAFDKRKPN